MRAQTEEALHKTESQSLDPQGEGNGTMPTDTTAATQADMSLNNVHTPIPVAGCETNLSKINARPFIQMRSGLACALTERKQYTYTTDNV